MVYRNWLKMRRSFSIVELVVVAAVISILAAMALAHFQSTTRRAYQTKALNLASQAGDIMNLYWQVTGGYYAAAINASGCGPPCNQNINIEGENYTIRGSDSRGGTGGEFYYINYGGNTDTIAVHRSSDSSKILDYNYISAVATFTSNNP